MKTFIRYNLVALAGVFVQLAVINVLERQFHLHYLVATAIAVETAVLHNYWWHWKWTWGARNAPASSLLRFQLTTGLLSIVGNLIGMKFLAGLLGLPALPANLVTIAGLYVINFALNERFVFRPACRTHRIGEGEHRNRAGTARHSGSQHRFCPREGPVHSAGD